MKLSGLARALLPEKMAAKNWFAFDAEQFDTVVLPFAWRHRLCPIGIRTKGKYRGGYSRERLVDWAE
ncbi:MULTISPECIES: hypothetical protein [unclassified Sphingobium]|uniref:hypothetical protein n=1 Tax=unclassified Sphingobium TaxID=2611147 RepID=UPI000B0597C5|nr:MULTISPECIES: hypothetical protein [Sphingomonadaceae]